MFARLKSAPRLLLRQRLSPVQGDRFQPTGFADLGAADYRRHDGTRMLLVESAQSMANRLEKVCLEGDGPHIHPDFVGLPYVVAELEGASSAQTSSLIEPHRINSPFIIKNGNFAAKFVEKSEYKVNQPVRWDKFAAALMHFDPNSIIHGVFMSNMVNAGRVRLPRALSGFVEAADVLEAVSGGVKNSPLDPTGTLRVDGVSEDEDKNVYSNVPYPRIEYTAGTITAYFNLDVALLMGYGLADNAVNLLIALSLLKVQRFLETGLRLRTACDLAKVGELEVQAPKDFPVPDAADLLAKVKELITECAQVGLFADPAVTVVHTKTKIKGTDEQKKATNKGPAA